MKPIVAVPVVVLGLLVVLALEAIPLRRAAGTC